MKSVEIQTNPDTWILGFRIDHHSLEEHLEALSMHSLPKPLEFTGAMDCRAGLVSHLSRQILFLADELSRDGSELLQNPLALAELEHSIMTNVLLGQSHNYTKYLSRSPQSAAPRQVRIVEAYLETHAHEAIDPKDLVRVTGYSLSAIYKGFQQFRGYSPMNFLKKNTAHQDPGKPVDGLSKANGYHYSLRLGIHSLGSV